MRLSRLLLFGCAAALSACQPKVVNVDPRPIPYDKLGGFFSFDFPVVGNGANALVVTYWGGDVPLGGAQRHFDILVNGAKVGEQRLDNNRPGQFFDITYPLPPHLTQGRAKVAVRFAAKPGALAGGVFGARLVSR